MHSQRKYFELLQKRKAEDELDVARKTETKEQQKKKDRQNRTFEISKVKKAATAKAAATTRKRAETTATGQKKKAAPKAAAAHKKGPKKSAMATVVATLPTDDSSTELLSSPKVTPAGKSYATSSPEEIRKLTPLRFITKGTPPEKRDESSISGSDDDDATSDDDYVVKDILDQKKAGRTFTTKLHVEYKSERRDWIKIGLLWHDNPELVRSYAKKKKLKGKDWKPAQDVGNELLMVMGIRGSGDSKECRILWDNGFLSWEPYQNVVADDADLVKRYEESVGL
jgi:hypothetical protein